MASISSLGVGSNLDLQGLLEGIMEAERAPTEARLELQEAEANASFSAIGGLKATVSTFQDSLSNLKNISFFNQRSAVSGDESTFTATANSDAAIGNYSIEVLDLASANKLSSAADFGGPTEVLGSGTLTISVGGSSFNIDIVTGENDTVAQVRDAINEALDNTGVRASLLTVDDGLGGTVTKFILTANDTGADSQIEIAVSDDDGISNDATGLSRLHYLDGDVNSQMDEIDVAQDASITIDGFTVSNSSNSFDDAIDGVTIIAVAQTTDPEGLSVVEDKQNLKSEIETFVASYNELMIVFNQLTDYDPSTETRGLLSADAGISSIESSIRRVLTGMVSGAADDFNNMAFLGLSTNRNGTVALDDTKLSAALTSRPGDIGLLFASDDGVAVMLDDLTDSFLASDGAFQTQQDGLLEKLRRINDERIDLEFRLTKMEARYSAQFSNLDILVGQLNRTGDFLTQQLAGIAKIGQKGD